MRRMSIFWGCTIPARFPFIEKSSRLALEALGVEPVDVAGFTCCPETTLVRTADEDAYYVTAARNLAVAERQGLPLLTPCNGCYSTFKTILSDLKTDWRRKQAIDRRLAASGLVFKGDIDVWHLVEWLSEDLGPAALSKRVVKPFWGMRIAVHHGCHLLRPSPAVRWDSPTAPTKFEQLVRALGATVVDYESKMDCCGNALDRVGERRTSLDMLEHKLSDIRDQGADALVVSCPSCFLQFDLNQATLLRQASAAGLPVFYISELIDLALGIDPSHLGLDMHRVGVASFLDRWAARLVHRADLMRTFNINELQICASCRACDVDCPVAQTVEDFVPSAIIGQLLAGDLESVLARPDVWHCLDCMTCYERCHSRLGMAEVFQKLKRLSQEDGKGPEAARSNFELFKSTGMLGAPRQSAREKLGLSELPPDGFSELSAILAESEDGE
jgi:heterodisulfide reductase subunit B/heterodisulfide reductase subunit C